MRWTPAIETLEHRQMMDRRVVELAIPAEFIHQLQRAREHQHVEVHGAHAHHHLVTKHEVHEAPRGSSMLAPKAEHPQPALLKDRDWTDTNLLDTLTNPLFQNWR